LLFAIYAIHAPYPDAKAGQTPDQRPSTDQDPIK
jgi:hypothetical protein